MHALEIHHDSESVVPLDPEDMGFKRENEDIIIPKTSWKTLEAHWTVVVPVVSVPGHYAPAGLLK